MLRVLGQVPVLRHARVRSGQQRHHLHPADSAQEPGDSRKQFGDQPRPPIPWRICGLNVFLDSILIRGISPDRIVSVDHFQHDHAWNPKTKQLIETPQYDLTVLNPGSGSLRPGLPQGGQAAARDPFQPGRPDAHRAGYLQQRRRSGNPGDLRALPGFQRVSISQHHQHQPAAGGIPHHAHGGEGHRQSDRCPTSSSS